MHFAGVSGAWQAQTIEIVALNDQVTILRSALPGMVELST